MGARFQDKIQKDLFEQFQEANKKITKKTTFFLPQLKKIATLSYENIIFLVIGFVMSSIIFFSLGVEKGRQDVNRINKEAQDVRPETMLQNKNQDPQKTSLLPQKVEQKTQNKYIIQLAAFRKKEAAEEEIVKLRKKGYAANIKKSGDFYQLYVGSFQNKETAQRLLKELEEKYKDCYIKGI